MVCHWNKKSGENESGSWLSYFLTFLVSVAQLLTHMETPIVKNNS